MLHLIHGPLTPPLPARLPQYFTASDPAFRDMVDRWVADGVVTRWEGPVGTLREGSFQADASQERYVARRGMRYLAQYLATQALREAGGAGSQRITNGTDGEPHPRLMQFVCLL